MIPQHIPARSVSAALAPMLDRTHTGAPGSTGKVLATYERSCYVDLDDHIIAVVAPELLNGPMNIVLARTPSGIFQALSAGDSSRVSVGPDGNLTIGNALRIDLSGASLWDPYLAPLGTSAQRTLHRRLEVIKTILAGAPPESVAHMASRPPRAVEGMDSLYSGLRQADGSMLAHAAERLIGLGPGLTPSGDDVLAGALIAVQLMQPTIGSELRRIVSESARERTTRVALAYLDAAARGLASEPWHGLVAHLRGEAGDGNLEELADAATRVIAMGETSGADMLTGFVLAIEALSTRDHTTNGRTT